MPAISVVIPVYNEGANIRPLANEIFDALARRIRYELIFVDDGSVDDTPDEIARVMEQNPVVSMCTHARNRGQSAAVRTGVEAARADVIAVMDGDGQNDPHDILNLFGQLAMVPSLSLVIGERRDRKDSWLRRVSLRIENAVRTRLLGDGVSDPGCGLKVFYREQYLDLPAFDHMYRFLAALMQRQGGRVHALPVSHRPSMYGVSKYGVSSGLWTDLTDLFGVRWLQKRRL